MPLLKSLFKWESRAFASALTDKKIIELEANRIKLLYESLKKENFTDDQAIQIISGIKIQK